MREKEKRSAVESGVVEQYHDEEKPGARAVAISYTSSQSRGQEAIHSKQ